MLSGRLLPEGATQTTLTPPPSTMPAALPAGLAQLCAEELRNRLPLLLAAVTAEELDAVRIQAHAMKGVAGNFGLPILADMLCMLEAAARGGRLLELQRQSTALPGQLDVALEQLFRQAG